MSDTGLLLLGPQPEMREGGEDDHPMSTIMLRSRGAVVRDDIATRYGDRPRYTCHEPRIKGLSREEIEMDMVME